MSAAIRRVTGCCCECLPVMQAERLRQVMQIVYDPRHVNHAPNALEGRVGDTLEIAARADTIARAITTARLGVLAPPDDYGLMPLLAVHTQDYLTFLQQAYARNSVYFGRPAPLTIEAFPTRYALHRPPADLGIAGYYASDADTSIMEPTWQAAYQSAQVGLSGAARLMRDTTNPVYALCRPPGHHAYADMYGGFCYLNNAAIAARFLQSQSRKSFAPPISSPDVLPDGPQAHPLPPHTAARIAILDIDFHHGNGTQAVFYADPTVLFCSLHGHPDCAYPFYSGMDSERGEGAGHGFNRNWPLLLHTSLDVYLNTLNEALEEISRFAPHFLVVSVGLDIAAGDPYGSFDLDNKALAVIARQIRSLRLPTLLVQEGGYQLPQLGERVVAFLASLL